MGFGILPHRRSVVQLVVVSTARVLTTQAVGGDINVDREKCAPHFSLGCSVCISSCVFTGGHYDALKEVHFR